MSEHLTFTAYKLQSEAVYREKEKLKALNEQLISIRKVCEHEFVEGACLKCGQNEEVYNHLVARGDRELLYKYQFID